jgi:nucleoside-diphosphate-sugar epimerase
MATILVTGATGFVGGRLLEELLRRGEPVSALVRNQGQAAALESRGVKVFVGDLCQPDSLAAPLRDVRMVYHCAAAVGPSKSRAEIYATNRDGVRHLLKAARRAAAPRIVLLSSINVLGTRNLDPASEDISYAKSHDPAADVKIEAEQIALEYYRRHGLAVTILRPGFIYGPGDNHNVPRLARSIQQGRFAYLGSRAHIIPIVHVSDVVRAMLLAAETPGANGRIYHITDGSRTTIGEFVDALARVLNCPPPSRTLPLFLPRTACVIFETLEQLGIRRQPAPINRAGLRFLGTSRRVEIERARKELGYAPQVQFTEGLTDLFERTGENADERTVVADSVR